MGRDPFGGGTILSRGVTQDHQETQIFTVCFLTVQNQL